MIARFDHAVIAVRDLEQTIQAYRELGFDVHPGGRHPGRGTHNAIVRFGLDYLELLAVADEAELMATGPSGQEFVEFLRGREGGLVGYALATTDIAADAARLERASVAADGPFAMDRLRPDGRLLAWRLLVPGGTPWRRPWPFLIEWDAPDEQRLAWEQPGTHANGVRRVAGIVLAVRDLDGASTFYGEHLGLSPQGRDEVPELVARRARFAVGALTIDLLAPAGDGPVQQVLGAEGEGPFQLVLAVGDRDRTRGMLAARGIDLEPAPAAPAALRIPATRAAGARLVLTEGAAG